MKNMTKISLFVMMSILCLKANAQVFGLKGGLNLANIYAKDDNETYSDDYKMNPGFHIGTTLDFPINDNLSFESGLLLTQKGYRFEDESFGADVNLKLNLYYFDVPLTLKLRSNDLGGGVKIFGAVGPYVGVGLAGKIKFTVEFQGDEDPEEEDIEWGNDEDEDHLKRLDLGLTFGGGLEINSALTLGLSYDLGLSNNAAFQDFGNTFKNRVLKISIGYRFLN